MKEIDRKKDIMQIDLKIDLKQGLWIPDQGWYAEFQNQFLTSLLLGSCACFYPRNVED